VKSVYVRRNTYSALNHSKEMKARFGSDSVRFVLCRPQRDVQLAITGQVETKLYLWVRVCFLNMNSQCRELSIWGIRCRVVRCAAERRRENIF